MYIKKQEDDLDCGIRVAFKIFGGKWKLCILAAIHEGVVRPADIQKIIPDASMRVIEMQLAELLFYGVVSKTTASTYPKKSEYALTSLGLSILPLLTQIDQWGTAHSDLIKEKEALLDHLQLKYE